VYAPRSGVAGNRVKLAKQITFKVYDADNRTFERVRFQTPKGQFYTPENVEQLKEQFASQMREELPGVHFKIIPTSHCSFTVVHNGGNA
jgi:hypothetical protein